MPRCAAPSTSSTGDIEPGDLFITNDPYEGGGTHLSDVTLVLPVFHEERLVAFVANKAHWTEVGGMAPGSFTTDSTEVYQEGLQFPLVKLMERGAVNRALIELIRANVRLPRPDARRPLGRGRRQSGRRGARPRAVRALRRRGDCGTRWTACSTTASGWCWRN